MVAVVTILIASFSPYFHVPDDEDTIDVLIIDGQSNAAYQTVAGTVNIGVVNATLGAPSHDAFYYGNSSRPTWYGEADTDYGIHTIYSDNGYYKVGGLVAPFGYYLTQKQDRDVLVIDVGISGQSISNLVPGSVGGNWKIDVIKGALDSITGYDNVNLLGWVWLQGEADTEMQISTYKSYFNDLEEWYSSIGCPNCYIVKTREITGGNATIAQSEIIASDPNVYLGTDITDSFTGTDYMLDNWHYSQAARIIIAEAVTETIPVKSYGDYDAINNILGVVPVILIIALVMGVAALMILKRDY